MNRFSMSTVTHKGLLIRNFSSDIMLVNKKYKSILHLIKIHIHGLYEKVHGIHLNSSVQNTVVESNYLKWL